MFKWIKNYFTLPVFDDDELTRRTRLLISILVPLAIVSVIAVGILVVLNGLPRQLADAGPVIAAVLIGVATLSAFPLVRRGFPSGLAIAILTLLFAVTTYWLLRIEGLSGGHTSFTYVLVIVLAGLLLGPRGALVFTVLTLVAIVGTSYAENQGLIPGRAGIGTADALIVGIVMVLTGVFLHYVMKSMQGAISRARRSAQAQAEANSELEAIRRSLEERVVARTQDLQSRSALLLTAIDLGRAAASLRDLDELAARMPHLIAEEMGFYHVGLFLMDEYREFAVLRGANSPEGQRMIAEDYRIAANEQSFLGTVTTRQELRVAVDVGPNAVSFVSSPFPSTRSELALPLIAGNRLIGALDLHSVESGVFTDQMIEVMRLLADQVAIAIESVQLFAQRQAALAAELRAYGAVSREAWQDMARVGGALRFLSDAPGVVRPIVGERPPVMEQARQTGRMITEADSTLAVPIQIREGVSIGALRLNKSSWSEDEIALVETLTEQLGAALESARLYQETQRREARERITREITEDIRRSVDMEVILRSAVSNLGEALGAPRTYVRLMLGEQSLGEESQDEESPGEEPAVEEPPVEKLPDEELPGEPLPEDVEIPSASPDEDAADNIEPLPDAPVASATAEDGQILAQGEEHDEP